MTHAGGTDSGGARGDPLDRQLIAGLRSASAYPADASAAAGVEEIQTHLSYVFRTAERVYKIRKDVHPGFVDFRSRAERNDDCLREVALNRRLAPDVYLGVAPLRTTDAGARVGDIAETLAGSELEHCVVMRRLPDGRDALSLLQTGALPADALDRVAATIAAFHERVRLHEPVDPDRWFDSIASPALDNFEALRDAAEVVAPERIERARDRTRSALARSRPLLLDRLARGRVVDGHGDLHLQHVWLERGDAPPVVIDCLEFSRDLRRVDAASDVAFTAMDLEYRGRLDLAERFLRVYARDTDDYDLYAVVDLFVSYRAAVRAKVAVLASRDPSVPSAQRGAAEESARNHLALAGRALEVRDTGRLVLLCGTVGSGKTTLAGTVADALGGVVVASDRVRKRLAGIAPTERVGPERIERLYAPGLTERVYAGLRERAEPVLRSGRPAILDATHASAELRSAVADWARAHGVRTALVEARCSPEVALTRLAEREAQGTDPSDAGPGLYRELAPRFEAPREWPPEQHFAVDMDREGWSERAGAVAAQIARL